MGMEEKEKVLITGGTGFIGRALAKHLLAQGYRVAFLSRSPVRVPGVSVHEWHPERADVPESALKDTKCLIHLAGANVGAKRWTEKRRAEILKSRVDSLDVLLEAMQRMATWPKVLVSASATGIYDNRDFESAFTENSPAADSFLATVTRQWETAADQFGRQGVRTVKLRTGVVLGREGGMLKQLELPARLGLLAAFGTGRQWLSWIHIADLCRMYTEAMEHDAWQGVYNAVAPGAVTNRQFVAAMNTLLHKRDWLPDVPAFVIRLLLGEMAGLLLEGAKVVNFRVQTETDFQYLYPGLTHALNALYPSGKL